MKIFVYEYIIYNSYPHVSPLQEELCTITTENLVILIRFSIKNKYIAIFHLVAIEDCDMWIRSLKASRNQELINIDGKNFRLSYKFNEGEICIHMIGKTAFLMTGISPFYLQPGRDQDQIGRFFGTLD